jgi:hypothetical protein
VRGGVWEEGIFLAIPLVVCFFSYLYAVSVLFGVVTRSTVAAVLMTILFWFFLFCLDRSEVALLLLKTGAEREAASLEPRIRDYDRRLAKFEKQSPEQQAKSTNVIEHWKAQRDELVAQRNSKALRNLTIAHQILYGIKTVMPKTRETTEIMNRKLLRPPRAPEGGPGETGGTDETGESSFDQGRREGPFTDSDIQALDHTMRTRSLWWVIGTSLAFEALVLLLAAWVFCRRDY